MQKLKETRNCEQVRTKFELKFPDKASPIKKTVYQIVRKFGEHGTILNRNKGNSGRSRIQRTEDNIERVRQLIEENPRWSVRRNGTGLSQSSFYRILKNDIEAYPCKIQIKHQLFEPDFARRIIFCNWLLDHGQHHCDGRGCLQHEWTCEHPKHKTLDHSSSKWKYF